ncbi:MAG: HlyC/CorC family transporter [Lachnospiraceae bacterium]|nr:HlyC/CorC family transporter [Lachnospiraceae bacterium]MBO7600227.1 HlyC/CorC family transporter [Lachnospiraceae bacterium]
MDTQSGDSKEKKKFFNRFFKKSDDDKAEAVEQEILSMVNEGHENGALESSEATMISNIFQFVDKEASDICTKRNDIDAISYDSGMLESLNHMLNSSFSRYPVYEDNIDHIVGILYLKDTCRIHAKDEHFDAKLSEIDNLVRKAMFIPETMNINDLFKTMQSKKNQLAVVVDEYGQTTGIVTMEDILEEIVGNIMDEYDVEQKRIRKRKGKAEEYIIDGSTSLEEIEEDLNIKIDKGEYETLNGFMISRLDRLPEKNEKFVTECDGCTFEILSVENRMVKKVIVRKNNKKEEETP